MMGYLVFLRTSPVAVRTPLVAWMERRGERVADRRTERIDRSVTIAASEQSPGWVALRDSGHFDLGAECEELCRDLSESLGVIGVFFCVNLSFAEISLVDRGELVGTLAEHGLDDIDGNTVLSGDPERWARTLADPSLEAALQRAMRTPLEDIDGNPTTGMAPDEVAAALGIREPLFPSEEDDDDEPGLAGALGSLARSLIFREEPDVRAEQRRNIDGLRAAMGAPPAGDDAAEGAVVIDFRAMSPRD
jgi:hypothetical protein